MYKVPTLHHKIFKSVILIILILVMCIFGLSSFFLYNYLLKNTNEKISLVSDNVVKALEIQDRVDLTQELWLYRSMEKPMASFQSLYERSGRQPDKLDFFELRDLGEKSFHFFILNADKTIIQSSYRPEVGINLNENEALSEFLGYVLNYPGIIHSQRAQSNADGSLQKIIYQATPDKKTILAISAVLDRKQYMFETAETYYFDFPMYIREIMNHSDMIKDIRIFNESGQLSFISNQQSVQPLGDKQRQAFEQVLHSGESVTLDLGSTVYHYAYFQPHDLSNQSSLGKVIEISIDTRFFSDILVRALAITTFIAAISLLVALFFGYVFGKKLVAPISEVTRSVHQIAAGDLSVPLSGSGHVLEIDILSTSVEHMRIQLLKQISELETRNAEIAQSYQLTIQAFFRTLEHREEYTAEHSLGVNKIAMALGHELKLSSEELRDLEWGSLLHDLGKLVIGNDILQKPDKLTDNEYEIIKNHPVIGYDVLPKVPFFQNAADIVHYHHERYDGKGYPEGLAGDKVPFLARICAVADSLHAMISHRPYRKACSFEAAVMEVKRCSGSQFDPEVVDALLHLYNKNPAGI